jgi:hypothetical protein
MGEIKILSILREYYMESNTVGKHSYLQKYAISTYSQHNFFKGDDISAQRAGYTQTL